MAQPHADFKNPKGTPRPAIADLLRVPRGYRMNPSTQFEGGDLMFHVCRNCGLEAAKHQGTGCTDCPPSFTLVNENNRVSGEVTGKDFSRDDLILMIGSAYREFVDMAKEMETIKAEADAARNAILEIVFLLTGKRETGDEWLDNLTRIICVLKQCKDVVQSVAHNAPEARAKELIVRFWNRDSIQEIIALMP